MLFPCIVVVVFTSQSIFANSWYGCSELYSSSAAFPIKMSKLHFPACVRGSVTKAEVMLSTARWRGGCVSPSSWTQAEPSGYGSPCRHSCLRTQETWQWLERNGLSGGDASLFLPMLRKIVSLTTTFSDAFLSPPMWWRSQHRFLHVISFLYMCCVYLGDEITKK